MMEPVFYAFLCNFIYKTQGVNIANFVILICNRFFNTPLIFMMITLNKFSKYLKLWSFVYPIEYKIQIT
jgi:hypothetical protein